MVDASNQDSNSLDPKTDEDVSKKAEEDAERPLIPDTGSARAARGCNPLMRSVPDNVSVESNTTSSEVLSAHDMVQRSPNLEKDLENSETSGDDEGAHAAINIDAKKSTPGATTQSSNFSQSNSQSEGLSKPTPDFPAQSLSHFTSANIIALNGAMVYGRSDHEQHSILYFLGRTDLPQHSSRCGSYGDFLAYSGQSITYILSNVDALLQSFLNFDDSNAASKVVWSYNFAAIVDLFRKLQRIDLHPHKTFPSLWISAGRLYPVSTAMNKRRSLTPSDLGSFSLDPTPVSQGCSLNDLEAGHVVKIILAALVAHVPKCSAMSWLAVRKLHASGQVAPFVDADNSPAEKEMIGGLVKTLQAFENEMALSLVVRLARSIGVRYHLARARALAENVEKCCQHFPPTFSRVIDYINANELKIRVVDNEGQPSVKSAEWIDPEIEPMNWHLKEWPIIIEWLRAVILKEWDGKARVANGSAVGGALRLMFHIRRQSISYFSSRVLSRYAN